MKLKSLFLLLSLLFFGSMSLNADKIPVENYPSLFKELDNNFAIPNLDPTTNSGNSEHLNLLREVLDQLKNELIKKGNDYETLVYYGRACLYAFNHDLLENSKEAEKYLKKAIKLNEKNAEAHFYLGNLYIFIPGKQQQGIDELQLFLNYGVPKWYPKVYLYLADGYYMLGSPSKVKKTPAYYSRTDGPDNNLLNSLKMIEQYIALNPFDNKGRTSSILFNNKYWGEHIFDGAENTEYINKLFNVTFSYPFDWTIRTDVYDKGSTMLNIPNKEPDGTINSNAVALFIKKYEESVNIDEFIKLCDKEKQVEFQNLTTEINDGTKCLITGKHSGSGYPVELYYIVKNKIGCLVIFTSTPSSYEKNKKAFRDFIETIEIKE
ncbi:MAG: hypothetical protein A3J83_06535 [Elusimicrobia bacterium RIFOXYA2_FULL_40_6]|nr:MAG: hypothetical protein A3J83_06535 [Elusimicrobia bacterium RIFOXYA2_FULL_40_6]